MKTYNNGSTSAEAIIYQIFTALTSVNANVTMVEMTGISFAVSIVACMNISEIEIITTIVIFTAANGTVYILIFIFLSNINISFNISISISIKFLSLVLLSCFSVSLWADLFFIHL